LGHCWRWSRRPQRTNWRRSTWMYVDESLKSRPGWWDGSQAQGPGTWTGSVHIWKTEGLVFVKIPEKEIQKLWYNFLVWCKVCDYQKREKLHEKILYLFFFTLCLLASLIKNSCSCLCFLKYIAWTTGWISNSFMQLRYLNWDLSLFLALWRQWLQTFYR
jgi:hypothetical protein